MGNFVDKRILATEEMVGASHGTKADTLNRLALMSLANTGYLAALPGLLRRSTFRYKDADEIYIGPGAYHLDGTDEIIVQWSSELTYTCVGLAASDWTYIYIDDSAVQTASTNVLTAAEFIDSTTEPAWSDTKHGWYNGSDRCIFAVLTGGASAIQEFWHDGGDVVTFTNTITDNSAVNITVNFADATAVTKPSFCTRVLATFVAVYVDASAVLYVRPNGATGTTGRKVCGAAVGSTYTYSTVFLDVDSSGLFEWLESGASTNTYTESTDGWLFPKGM